MTTLKELIRRFYLKILKKKIKSAISITTELRKIEENIL